MACRRRKVKQEVHAWMDHRVTPLTAGIALEQEAEPRSDIIAFLGRRETAEDCCDCSHFLGRQSRQDMHMAFKTSFLCIPTFKEPSVTIDLH